MNRSLDGFLDESARRSRRSAIDFLTALRDNPPPDITRLYWLARVTLVSRRRGPAGLRRAVRQVVRAARRAPVESAGGGRERGAAAAAARASCSRSSCAEGTGRSASVHDLRQPPRLTTPTAEDLAELRKALASTCRAIRSRRRRPDRRGPASTCAARCAHATRTGEITQLARRDRPHRTRPLLLLIDVSGSLRAHTPDYLRFAWAAQAETFTFGTRLTRVTRAAARARRRHGAGERVGDASRTPTAARASARRCRSSWPRRATPTAPAAR